MKKAAGVLFLLFIILKQFYLFPSGSVGIGDICLGLTFALLFLKETAKPEARVFFYAKDRLFYLFLGFVLIINLIYAVVQRDAVYLKYCLYWIFSGCAVWSFRKLFSADFARNVSVCCCVNILIQFLVFLSGRGRYWYISWGGSRFMGTFNDPNQFAFFLFTMVLFISMYAVLYRKKIFLGVLPFYLFLLIKSKSTGIMLGTAVFFFLLAAFWLWDLCTKKGKKQVFFFIAAAATVLAVIFAALIWPKSDFNLETADFTILSRIQEKIWKFSKGNLWDILYDRKLERLVIYPKYLLYGAGEGAFERFPLGEYVNRISPNVFDGEVFDEVHSSFFSVLFCYGIVPTVLLCLWIRENLKGIGKYQLAAVIALLLESFTLMNLRQPMFWFILVFWSTCELWKAKKADGTQAGGQKDVLR